MSGEPCEERMKEEIILDFINILIRYHKKCNHKDAGILNAMRTSRFAYLNEYPNISSLSPTTTYKKYLYEIFMRCN